jgi:hypothetical protein
VTSPPPTLSSTKTPSTLRVEGPSFKAMISGWSSKASEVELKGVEGGR